MSLLESNADKIVPRWHLDAEVRARLWYPAWRNAIAANGGDEAKVLGAGVDRWQTLVRSPTNPHLATPAPDSRARDLLP